MALKPGTIEDVAGSMAEEMEQVFRETLPSVVPGADPGGARRNADSSSLPLHKA